MSSMLILSAVQAYASALLEPLGYEGMASIADPARNKNTQLGKRFGVRPGGIEEIPGAVRSLTFDHTFEVVLSDIMPGTTTTDAFAAFTVAEAIDRCHSLYGQLVAEKCGIPDIVLNVKTLKVTPPVYDFDAKAFHVVASFKVTYRQA